jgi:FixJ family two-component response regulator
MPSKYRRVPRVKFTLAELREAAAAIAPLAASVAEHVANVAVARARDRVAGARRGRGQRLSAFEQLAVIFYAVAVDARPREIATALGMEHRTVRRLLATTRYRKFSEAVDRQIAETFAIRSSYLRAKRFFDR